MDSRALIACVFLMAACSGPKPEVVAATVEVAPGQPGHQRVTIDLRNRSGGHGQVEVLITLVGASGHRIEASHEVELAAHEQLQLAVDVPAPPERYTAEVTSRYPD